MPAVARKDGNDSISTGHGCDSTTVTEAGSGNVFVNGIGACRKGDVIRIHTIPSGKSCVPHSAKINVGSGTVFVNGIPIARKGDSADAGNISSGSGNVFAGG
jgi:uncharacterized Zn-binding protein involved in type VI secretion